MLNNSLAICLVLLGSLEVRKGWLGAREGVGRCVGRTIGGAGLIPLTSDLCNG